MNQSVAYDTKEYKVLMPESYEVKTVVVNRLKDQPDAKDTPVTKVKMPIESGFYRGVSYDEENTLLEYPDKSWEKLTTINFGEGAESMFGTDKIEKVSRLTKIDTSIKNAVVM